jgi:GT2 family glycosyltransferase
LAAALEFAGERGANAVSFHVQTYAPVNDDWDRLHSLPPLSPNGPEDVFRYLLPEHVDHGLPHVKAWLQPDGERVDLHTSGGHHVVFNNARVKLFPLPFLLKHYPIRSQAHGERKVLVERLPRYLPAERKKNWHVQYDWAWSFRGQPSLPAFTRRPVELLPDSNTAIVTLTRFPDIFERFAASVERHEPVRRRIVVTSGGCKIERLGWEVIEDLEPEFNFARNANIGIARAGGADVVLVNDDVELVQPIIDELQWSAHNSGADIVTPQIIGDGINNRWAQASLPLVGRCMVLLAPEYIPFVCVLLRREMIRDVGLLDEGFAGYGGEDEEYCDRARKVGAELAVSAAQVRHGFGGLTYSSSFFRVMTPAERDATMRQNRLRAATLAGDERPPEQADSDPRGRGEPGETQT